MSAALSRSREQRLVAAAAAGDRSACEVLIRHHQAGVYAYIVRMCGRPELAEDVVQETFVRVLTNLDRFDSRYRFSTWVFTIARRVFLNMLDKRAPASSTDSVEGSPGTVRHAGESAETLEHQIVCRDLIQRALMCVSMEQREVLILFHQHEWPIWLIANHLDKPEGTIKSHLHRGRARLREALERLGAAQHLTAWRQERGA
jgi:RNA polymerase sigma-70 factor (ECF subfamily)